LIFLYFEYVLNLKPCFLCRIQQLVYLIIFLISIFIFFIPQKRKYFLLVIIFLFFIGGITAVYQLGIENNLWYERFSCKNNNMAINLENLKNSLLYDNISHCKIIRWSFLGISLAGYNSFVSFMFLIFFYLYQDFFKV